jgi:isopentenyldiphosphate isomerase
MTDINQENKRLLDIVDEQDKIIDSKSRTEVHDLGLLHRQVHVWMFDKNKNIFFQKRGLHRPSAGQLDATIGGHVNQGEEYIDAAVRETKEETGISITPSDLEFLKKFKNVESSKEKQSGVFNNFFQTVYIYTKPIEENMLKKEVGIPGGGFQKLSYNFLLNPEKKYIGMFQKVVLTEEIPLVLEFLK